MWWVCSADFCQHVYECKIRRPYILSLYVWPQQVSLAQQYAHAWNLLFTCLTGHKGCNPMHSAAKSYGQDRAGLKQLASYPCWIPSTQETTHTMIINQLHETGNKWINCTWNRMQHKNIWQMSDPDVKKISPCLAHKQIFRTLRAPPEIQNYFYIPHSVW